MRFLRAIEFSDRQAQFDYFTRHAISRIKRKGGKECLFPLFSKIYARKIASIPRFLYRKSYITRP